MGGHAVGSSMAVYVAPFPWFHPAEFYYESSGGCSCGSFQKLNVEGEWRGDTPIHYNSLKAFVGL